MRVKSLKETAANEARRLTPARHAGFTSTPAGFTLVEIMMASVVMSIVLGGLLSMIMQSRRLTESSIVQNSAVNIVQGYLEQMKSMDYASVTLSPATGTATIATQLNESATDPLTLSNGTPPTTLPAIGTTPTGAVDNVKSIAIRYPTVNPNDTLSLNLWIWVVDLTGSSTYVTNAKSITMIYTYTFRDGGRLRQTRGTIRSIRSVVPTF
jgi:prepilin-type N-terminal cleavage/methylation domain-containing protein